MAGEENKQENSSAHTSNKGSKNKKKSNKKHNKKDEGTALLNGEVEPCSSGASLPDKPSLSPLLPEVEKYLRKLKVRETQDFQFWNTQPVPSINEEVNENVNEAIEDDKRINEIRSESYTLPAGFEWDTVDLSNPGHLQDLYVLLNENYVEDDDNMFRFDYSKEFLHWALMPPGWKQQWHVGVRVSKNSKLIAFISAVPATIRIKNAEKELVEINFLCVHKKLRSKRLAPVLIKEITRRVNLTGIFQAVYTAGVILPRPVSSCRYWHRSLNPKKLIEVKFSHLGKNMTMQRTLRLYKLPVDTVTPGFRQMVADDLPKCHILLENYLRNFDLVPVFTLEEFKHWFFPRPDIIDSFVVETNNEITDFVSYYTLPSTVVHHPTYKSIKAAYSFYNVSSHTPWKVLMKDALISAKQNSFDVFNALDLMDNSAFLEELKFGQGDGNLQYYLYNWKCPKIPPNKVGLVLQ